MFSIMSACSISINMQPHDKISFMQVVDFEFAF